MDVEQLDKGDSFFWPWIIVDDQSPSVIGFLAVGQDSDQVIRGDVPAFSDRLTSLLPRLPDKVIASEAEMVGSDSQYVVPCVESSAVYEERHCKPPV